MVNSALALRTLHDGRIAIPALVLVVVAVGLLWYFLASPLVGTVSATLVNADGETSAIAINLRDLTSHNYTLYSDQRALVIAAVPSPTLDKVAFVTRTNDKMMHVLVGNADGANSTPILDGVVGIPSWSPDGNSIAVATRADSDGDDVGAPESWTVVRAVTHGDSLPVGKGYRPFPSPNQRTFALTSEGVALLSYNDSEPNLVIASPKPVTIATPFAASQDGMRVAWVAPADNSIQVYENVNGYFIPLLLNKELAPQSLVFSPNGKYLLGTTHTETATTVHLIKISNGNVRTVGEFPGRVRLHTWLYDK